MCHVNVFLCLGHPATLSSQNRVLSSVGFGAQQAIFRCIRRTSCLPSRLPRLRAVLCPFGSNPSKPPLPPTPTPVLFRVLSQVCHQLNALGDACKFICVCAATPLSSIRRKKTRWRSAGYASHFCFVHGVVQLLIYFSRCTQVKDETVTAGTDKLVPVSSFRGNYYLVALFRQVKHNVEIRVRTGLTGTAGGCSRYLWPV